MNLSLRVVLLISIIGIQLLTVFGILFSSYLTTQSALLDHARQLMQEVSRHAIDRSEQFLEPARVTASLTRRLADSDILAVNDPELLERWFFEEMRIYPWFSGIYFGGADGGFVYVKREAADKKNRAAFLTKIVRIRDGGASREVEFISRTNNFETLSRRMDPNDSFDPRERPWFKLAQTKKKIQWTDPYIFFTSRQPGVSATIGAYEEDKFRGAIGVDIEIGQLSSFLGGLQIGKEGSAFILNRNGDVIAHPQPGKIKVPAAAAGSTPRFVKIGELDDPIAHAAFEALQLPFGIISIDGPVVRRFEHAGRRYLSVFTPFFSVNWPWTIVIYVPEDDYLGLLHKQMRLNIYLGIAIAFFACLLSFLIWRTIARPMRQLSADAIAVQDGDFSHDPKTTSVFKEVNAAGDAFRKMVVGLRAREEENIHLRRLQSRLIETMRRSAAGHFASAIAHELNNPLAAVLTNLQIVSRILKRAETSPSERLVDAIDGAQSQAERAGAIIRGLREFVEAEEADRAEEEINQVVREATELAKTDENIANAQFSFDLAANLPMAVMNRVQIQQVVLNLSRNAAEAMSEASASTIRISTTSPNSAFVEVSIEDDGPGIPDDIADQLFKPMVTTKPTGMGVGLSICRTIVESHGGKISASNIPTGGARFTFTIATGQRNGTTDA
jgi:C4-dicarboxylate-specific signal transduction histidine kinase